MRSLVLSPISPDQDIIIPNLTAVSASPRNITFNKSGITGILYLTMLHRYCIFYKLKICGSPSLSKSIGTVFPVAFAHLVSVCHSLFILAILPTFNRNIWKLTEGSDDGSAQFSSVTQSCPTLCDAMDCSTPGLPVHQQLPEFTQTHVHWVSDAIQPSYPLLSSFPSAFILSQKQGLFKWVSCLHQVAKALEFQLQHQSFQWTPRTHLF